MTVSQKPEKWQLPIIFMTAGILGLVATIASVVMVLLCLGNMDHDNRSVFFKAFENIFLYPLRLAKVKGRPALAILIQPSQTSKKADT